LPFTKNKPLLLRFNKKYFFFFFFFSFFFFFEGTCEEG
jgi:hypothetical protein